MWLVMAFGFKISSLAALTDASPEAAAVLAESRARLAGKLDDPTLASL